MSVECKCISKPNQLQPGEVMRSGDMLTRFATPLRILTNCSKRFGCEVYGKLEVYNPTGSHKDRESEQIMKYAVSKGIRSVAIASTGNAAISLAAYSYVHGIVCHVYLPRDMVAERLAQIRAYHPILHFADNYAGAVTKCHNDCEQKNMLNCNPGSRFEKVQGDSGIGVEIARRIRMDYVVCPTNNGTLLSGVWMGIKVRGMKTRMVAAVTRRSKVAEAISGFHRLEEPALTVCLDESKGEVIEVSDLEIADAAHILLRDGLIVEGAAAAAIASLNHFVLSPKSKVCCVITGSGLKFPSTVKELLKRSAT